MKSRTFFILVFIFLVSLGCFSCKTTATDDFSIDSEIAYCRSQAMRTLVSIPSLDKIPNSMDLDSIKWRYTQVGSWTCGFWPGILWYLYEDTKDNMWREAAGKVTDMIAPLAYRKAKSHDSGFIMMCSLGNGYRLTGKPEYKEGLLHAADSLAMLYNPVVGTILSWPGMVKKENWPHNTIIDNMMNLELLFWAARNGGGQYLYDIACKHAETTMKHQFRKDYSCYHVAVYDTLDGHFIKGVTHQGLSDDSMWARGQAWAIYGYTMVYRETHDVRFLDFARKVSDVYLKNLPEDYVPYWDFNDPSIPDAPRDASAACVVASALLELSGYLPAEKALEYKQAAVKMLASLSSDKYQCGKSKPAFLLHSTGHLPAGSEIDASIIYADYYYMEALLRLKRLTENKPVIDE